MALQAYEYTPVRQHADEAWLSIADVECPEDGAIHLHPISAVSGSTSESPPRGSRRVAYTLALCLAVLAVVAVAGFSVGSRDQIHPQKVMGSGNSLVSLREASGKSQCGCLKAVQSSECPTMLRRAGLEKCDGRTWHGLWTDHVGTGRLCDGGGSCDTDGNLNNCGSYDIYRKVWDTPCSGPLTINSTTGAPPQCGCFEAIPGTSCPGVITVSAMSKCTRANIGQLCDADGECGTDADLNNCGHYDIYRKVRNTPCNRSGGIDSTAAAIAAAAKKKRRCGCLKALSGGECPGIMTVSGLPKCDSVGLGSLCDGDGECGTDNELNNCGHYDVYRLQSAKCDGSSWDSGTAQVSGPGFGPGPG